MRTSTSARRPSTADGSCAPFVRRGSAVSVAFALLTAAGCGSSGGGFGGGLDDGGATVDQRSPASGDLIGAPLDFASSPLDFASSPLDFAEAPPDFAEAPFDFKSAPFDFKSPPFDFKSPPFDFKSPPFDFKSPADLAHPADGGGGPTLLFSPMTSGTTYPLTGIWGTSATNVYASGQAATLLHYNGATWTKATVPTNQNLWAVGGSASNDVYAVGELGVALHSSDGATWKSLNTGTSQVLRAVCAPSAGRAWAAGGNTAGYLFGTTNSGATWTQVSVGSIGVLWGLWCDATSAWAVGSGGVVLRYNGTSWVNASATVGASNDLYAATGAGSYLYFSGVGEVARSASKGASFSIATTDGFASLGGVAASSLGAALAVGNGGVAYATSNGGASWKKQLTGTTRQLTGAWRGATLPYFVVGDGGTILRAQ